jgi:GH35 family endo-1,4-beta-xylanase
VKTTAQKISPEDYILSVLSPEDRIDAAFMVAREAFKKRQLTMNDVKQSISLIRGKIYGKKK